MVAINFDSFDPMRRRDNHQDDLRKINGLLGRHSGPVAQDLYSREIQAPGAIHAYNFRYASSAGKLLRNDLDRIEMYNQRTADFAVYFLSSHANDARSNSNLTVVGSFATVVALEGQREPDPNDEGTLATQQIGRLIQKIVSSSKNLGPRFRPGFLEYSPNGVEVTPIDGTGPCLRELGFSSYLPKNFAIRDFMHPAISTGPSRRTQLVHAVGTRNVFAIGIDDRTRLIGRYRCQLITMLEEFPSEHDVALLNRLVAPNSLVDVSKSNMTHPCVGAYEIFRPGHTETRFVFFHRDTGLVLAIGILSACQPCPFQHPGEFVDAISALARSA